MGIKVAYNELLAVLRRLYAKCRRALRAHWQVSGRFHSGAKQPSLSSSPYPQRRGKNSELPSCWLSRRKNTTRRVRRAVGCKKIMSQAAESPMCVRSKICRRKLWRRNFNVTDWTSAARCSPTLKSDERGSRTGCFRFSSALWAFPSSGFSPRKFETSMPSSPLTVRLKSRSRNAKS